ncbi:MAG: VWA domain-containing protein [Leptolyngbya sp. PLA3]|nr:MAG: VWA domain-containing protein [Cyanobacteria bacterium CYA]MCE7967283.1 VWA domain-containing protein [Leptolyngbya sp. PL-A3]
MLRLPIVTALALIGLILPVVRVHAQPIDRPPIEPGPDIIIPQRHWIRPGMVEVKGVEVDVDVVDQVATTHMAIVLHNPTGAPREAQLVLPVPRGAAIRSFGVDAISEEPNAVLLPREEATRIYRDIVSKMVDPGLLEFVGTGMIRSSVFPVPAGGTATFRVVYEHVMPSESGRVDYILPRSQSLSSHAVNWTIGMRIRSSRDIGAVYSPTHALDESRTSARDIRVKVLGAGQSGPFRLCYVPADKEGAAITTILYPDGRVGDGKGGYFMLFLSVPERLTGPVMKREVTLVLDRSGSMRGEKIEQAKSAALQVIEALNEGELFNIIDYSDTIESFAPAPVAKNADTVAKAREYIGLIKAVGGTNIHDALLTAVKAKPTDGYLPIVLFLTDGLPTVGPTSEVEIRQAVEKANEFKRRVFSFGVGYDVNAPLLTALAQQSRAVPTFVEPQEDVEVKVGRVFDKLAGPVLAMPELRVISPELAIGPSPIRELMPGTLPDLFAGEQMIVLGKYTGDKAESLSVFGQSNGEQRTFSTILDPRSASSANGFVARLWAQRKIAALIDQIRQTGADGQTSPDDPKYKELVDSVVALSQEYGILTEYTAFIAVEDMYKQNLADHGAMQYYLGLQAVEERSGARGVQREMLNQQRQQTVRPASPADGDLVAEFAAPSLPGRLPGGGAGGPAGATPGYPVNTREIVNAIQNISGRTFYLRGERWVEAGLLEKADEAPEQTIAFGSADYDKIVDQLIEQNQQAVLGLNTAQDVYLLVGGKRVLLRRATE